MFIFKEYGQQHLKYMKYPKVIFLVFFLNPQTEIAKTHSDF